MRTVAVATLMALLATSAFAQIPAGPGQLPGTLPPAPPIDRAAAAWSRRGRCLRWSRRCRRRATAYRPA